ncbi:MAG: hypothetical protein CVU78_06965 [Elusimicrobia bacterium HGW-Elusimicrobia-2]|nr:MAG: hypothetical protein CVU78_06965 [Elusimicrobia bacterium HGW-Elusimicrobia-2]
MKSFIALIVQNLSRVCKRKKCRVAFINLKYCIMRHVVKRIGGLSNLITERNNVRQNKFKKGR